MDEILSGLNIEGDMKKEEIYNLLKTNSSKLNSEISNKIKSLSKSKDFFNHYSNKTSLYELLYKSEFINSKNYDGIFSSFDSNIESYISCFTIIILSIKLFLKTQEILNKIFLSSKKYLKKLKIEDKIENVSQENLFSFIEKLLETSQTKTVGKFSSHSSISNSRSFTSISTNFSFHQKFIRDRDFESFCKDDFRKTLAIINEESYTPKFCLNIDKNIENQEKENCQNICILKGFSFSSTDMKENSSFKNEKDTITNKVNSIAKNDVLSNNDTNVQQYENLLEMINYIYRKGIINSEEKIRLKQLVIAKSKKLENLYYNIYKNKKIDKNILRSKITKLLN